MTTATLEQISTDAAEQYKAAVFAAVEGDTPAADDLHRTLTLSGRTMEAFKRDVSRVQSRKQAVESIRRADAMVERRQQQADELRKKREPLETEIRELEQRIRGLRDQLLGLGVAIDPAQIQQQASAAKRQARRTLRESADPSIDEQIREAARLAADAGESVAACRRLIRTRPDVEKEIRVASGAIAECRDSDKLPGLRSRLAGFESRLKAIDEAESRLEGELKRGELLRQRMQHLEQSKLDWRNVALD